MAVSLAAAQPAAAARVAPSQRIVSLFTTHGVRAEPNISRKVLSRIPATRPITDERTKLPVLGSKRDAQKRLWLHVRVPGRANGQKKPPSTGWITTEHTLQDATPWHLTLDVGSRTLRVYHAGRQEKKYSVIVGAPATPTPHGQFFVEESVKLPSDAAGEPYALALSARSSVFQDFDGGPGQIAVHGRNNIGGTLGTAVSHGCIRASTTAVTWLAKHIGQGVPVTIGG